MFERGWDLLDYFRGWRPWGQLDRILARLPHHSHYRAALQDDDEYAALIAKFLPSEDAPAPPPPLTGYSDVVLRLDNVYDAINALRETLTAVYSKKGSHIMPVRAPRPENAAQRAKKAQTMAKLYSIEDAMLGRR